MTALCDWMTFLNLHSLASEFELQGVDMFGKRVGFLKFKADIIDEETKTKVIDWIVAITVVLLCICLDLRNPSWSCILDWMSLRTNNNGLGNPNFLVRACLIVMLDISPSKYIHM